MSWTNQEAERVRTIEVTVEGLKETVDDFRSDVTGKLDDLLALKAKGMGAFWVASVIVGGVFSGLVAFVSDWFK